MYILGSLSQLNPIFQPANQAKTCKPDLKQKLSCCYVRLADVFRVTFMDGVDYSAVTFPLYGKIRDFI